MEARLSIITLGVKDLAVSRSFYEKGLGWPLASGSEEGIAFFQLGGLRLALYPHDLLAEDADVSPEGCGFRGFTLAQNVRSKEEVTVVLAAAEKAGAKIVKPARDVFWGGHSGYFSDPDGYLWEVAWNPFLELNERGEIGPK
jgi:Lactoylglutathione lyase and related lyases